MNPPEADGVPTLSGETFAPPSEQALREAWERAGGLARLCRAVPGLRWAARGWWTGLAHGEWSGRAGPAALALLRARGDVPGAVWPDPRERAVAAHFGKQCRIHLGLPASHYHPEDRYAALIAAYRWSRRNDDLPADDRLLRRCLEADFGVTFPPDVRAALRETMTVGGVVAYIAEHTPRTHLPARTADGPRP